MTWIFLIIATIGYVLNIKDKKIESYIVWFISNICWMIYGFSTQQYAMAVMFIVYTLFTIYGMYHENLFGKWYIQYPPLFYWQLRKPRRRITPHQNNLKMGLYNQIENAVNLPKQDSKWGI